MLLRGGPKFPKNYGIRKIYMSGVRGLTMVTIGLSVLTAGGRGSSESEAAVGVTGSLPPAPAGSMVGR